MNRKNKQHVKNIERAAILKDSVFRNGLDLIDMAKDLHVSPAAVHRFAYGSVDKETYREWVKAKLGNSILMAMDSVS